MHHAARSHHAHVRACGWPRAKLAAGIGASVHDHSGVARHDVPARGKDLTSNLSLSRRHQGLSLSSGGNLEPDRPTSLHNQQHEHSAGWG